MARIQRFNPPPTWPRPPEGWQPPRGWVPDPSWGPVPDGWPLWVSERANPRAWGLALLSALGWLALLSLIGVVVSGGRFGAEAFGEVLAREVVAGVLTGVIAWFGRSRWPWWLYPLVVLGFSLLLSVVSTAGRMA